MSGPVDPYAVPDAFAERFVEVKAMADALRAGTEQRFFVLLTRYYIEGDACLATALTVSATATPNLEQTQAGFVCDAFFPPQLLSERVRAGRPVESGAVEVRLEARLEDILQVMPLPPGG